MIVDSSPLIAILSNEADAEFYIQAISRTPRLTAFPRETLSSFRLGSRASFRLRFSCNATRYFAALAS